MDATFYRTPSEAISAPPEQLAYVAAFDPQGRQRDAMAVVDCDPTSYRNVDPAWEPAPGRRSLGDLLSLSGP